MTIEEVRKDLILSSIYYVESEYYDIKFKIKPYVVWVAKNREENIDKIKGYYDARFVPKCVKRFYKSYRVSVNISFTTKPEFEVFHSELEEVCSEIFAKFKILNKNEISDKINYITIYDYFQDNCVSDILSFDDSSSRYYKFDNWYYKERYSEYYYSMRFSVYNDLKIYSLSNQTNFDISIHF